MGNMIEEKIRTNYIRRKEQINEWMHMTKCMQNLDNKYQMKFLFSHIGQISLDFHQKITSE
jgi:hypothetical protein